MRWLNLNGSISTKLKSADKAQTLSYWNAAVEHGKALKENDENLASNHDNKQIAELLLPQTDDINRRERLIKAVENAMKFMYQPQIPDMFLAVSNEIRSRFVVLQQQNSSIGRVKRLMAALQDENQILNYLDPDKIRAVDARMIRERKAARSITRRGQKRRRKRLC